MHYLFDPGVFVATFGVSAGICGALVLAQPWLVRHIRAADDLLSIQCAHLRRTPRIGGVGVLAAMLVGVLLVLPAHPLVPVEYLLFSLVPVFAAGLAEDLGVRVSARSRLVAAAGSAALAVALLGLWVPPLGIAGLDLVFGVAPLAIAATILWATGVCHALNLVDGVNGLVGALAVLIATGIALVALQADVPAIAAVAVAVVPAILGFLLFNWPLGRIFLGDSGAYALGHVLVWLAIILAWVSPEVSAVALALMFFWPVADTLLAISRRLRAGRGIGAPDRLHFHQLVMRAILLLTRGGLGLGAANSATALVVLPLAAAPVAAAVYLWDRPLAALLAWAGFGLLFTVTYLLGVRFVARLRWRRFGHLLREGEPRRIRFPVLARRH